MTQASRPARRPTPGSALVLPANANRDLWLEARRWRDGVGYCIGASDAPGILDLPECGTPREVFHDKVNKVQRPMTEAMRWGRLHEKTIAWEWEHRRQSVIRNVGLVSNIRHPWLQCTLDRVVRECPDNPEVRSRCALEVKTRGAYRKGRLHAEVPDDILAQCMVQMLVTGFRHVHTAVLVGGSELHDPVVWWDEDVAAYVLRELQAFKVNHLEAGVEPDWSVTKSEKEIALHGLLHPDRVGQIGIDDISQVIDYGDKASAAGTARKAREKAVADLLRLADGKQTLLFNGEPAVWWREGVSTRVDLDVLARFPEAYAAAVTAKTTWTICIDPLYRGIEPKD